MTHTPGSVGRAPGSIPGRRRVDFPAVAAGPSVWAACYVQHYCPRAIRAAWTVTRDYRRFASNQPTAKSTNGCARISIIVPAPIGRCATAPVAT